MLSYVVNLRIALKMFIAPLLLVASMVVLAAVFHVGMGGSISALNAVVGALLCILGSALFPHLRELGGAPPDVPTGFLSTLFNAIGIVILVVVKPFE